MITFHAQAYSAYENQITKSMNKSTQWIFQHANACLLSDNVHRVNANGECLAMQTYSSNNIQHRTHPNLLIFIHGDGIPGGGPSDYLKYQATRFANQDTVATVLIRPGYYDSYGNYSTGESYAFACNGYPCDGYRPKVVQTLASAIEKLKQYYQPRCTILVGHSGGAIMSGIILGKYPNLANGAVLASVTYNVLEFSKRHPGWGEWKKSLSPDAYINKIPKQDFIYIISGNKDDDTYPDLARKYYSALEKSGIDAKFISVPNGTHNSIVLDQAKEFDDAIDMALKKCATSK